MRSINVSKRGTYLRVRLHKTISSSFVSLCGIPFATSSLSRPEQQSQLFHPPLNGEGSRKPGLFPWPAVYLYYQDSDSGQGATSTKWILTPFTPPTDPPFSPCPFLICTGRQRAPFVANLFLQLPLIGWLGANKELIELNNDTVEGRNAGAEAKSGSAFKYIHLSGKWQNRFEEKTRLKALTG